MLYKVKILKGGRITLPMKLRKAWNLNDGDSLILEQSDEMCRIKTIDDAILEAQQAVQKYIGDKNVSLNQELS